MSEKMDGVRTYWDGEKLISRQGRAIPCHSQFTAPLPTTKTLDGELWMGRGTTFSDVMAVLRSKNGDWSQLGYYIFDVPSSTGTFEERMEEMKILQLVASHIYIV